MCLWYLSIFALTQLTDAISGALTASSFFSQKARLVGETKVQEEYFSSNDTAFFTSMAQLFDSGSKEWPFGLEQSFDSFGQQKDHVALAVDHQLHKNKIVLVVLEISYLGLLGVDRMYIGQVGQGILKLAICVLAWLFYVVFRKSACIIPMLIWGAVDWFIVMVNCLEGRPDIHAFGMNASFGSPWEIKVAFCLALIGFMMIMCPCASSKYSSESSQSTRNVHNADSIAAAYQQQHVKSLVPV